jgi:hypothetical protein
MSKTNKLILLFVAFICLFGMLYSCDFALADRNLEISDYPDAPLDAPAPGKDTTLPQFMKYLFNFGIGIGGVLVFLVFVFAGIKWITSAGNPTSIGAAKKMMFGGVAGLALLLLSYVIVITLNPELKTFKEVDEIAPTTGAYITGTFTGVGGEEEEEEEEEENLYQEDIPSFRKNFTPETIEFISDKDELYSIFAYDKENYKGDAVEIINTGKGSAGNIAGKKSIAFFWNRPGVYIYEEPDHQGKRPPKHCLGPINDLDKDQWHDKAQSIRFNNTRGNEYGAVLFEENDFEGEKCTYAYENDVMDLSSESNTYIHPIGNEELSSIHVFRIPDAVEGKVTFYDSIDCKGRKKEYTPTEVMVFDDLTKEGCSIGDCLFDKINENDEEKELHRNIKAIKIEGQFYVLLGSKPGEHDYYQPPPTPDPPIIIPPEYPTDSECVKRMLKALKDGIAFDIVRPTDADLHHAHGETICGVRGCETPNFHCDDVCAKRGQDCLGIGLYRNDEEVKTYCRYIVHNEFTDCQLSENLEWGECDMGFKHGSGFCAETFPVHASWGYVDTGCYCVDKGYLPDKKDE